MASSQKSTKKKIGRKDGSCDAKPNELKLLYEISRILDAAPDMREVLPPVLKALAEHMGMKHGTVTLLNRETGEISTDAAYGLSAKQQQKGRYRVGEGVTGKVVESGKPAIVPRISEEPMFLNKTGVRKGLDRKNVSFTCVPVKLGSETIGALSADRLFSESESLEEDVRLLSVVASMIAQAVGLRRQIQEERERLLAENVRLQEELRDRFKPSNIIGNSKAMHSVYDQIAQVSSGEATALIMGESGTGKELVAHAIHFNSARENKPFVKLNCAALPEDIVESELFGHEKGAFTGAESRRIGRFEKADGGTIFLDEIGDLPPHTQIRLLRVLQEKEFERVGSNETVKVDVRVIAATHRDLERLVELGKFRQDLYYRLNVFPIMLPPLRERRTDIPLLADFFVEKYAGTNHKDIKRISTPAIDMLMAYHWPGNVRELDNCIERAVLITTDEVIHSHHLPPTLQTAEATGTVFKGDLQSTLDNVERELLLDALKSARGNMAKAARTLGLTERVMGLRVKKHAIDPKRFRV